MGIKLKLFLRVLKVWWWPVSESNQGHSDFQSLALPTELTGHVMRSEFYSFVSKKELIVIKSNVYHSWQT